MKKREIVIVALICVLCIISYFAISFLYKDSNNVTVKTSNGEVLLEFDINTDAYYSLEGEYGAFHIEVKDNKCRAIDVDCPNHICEKTGYISIENPLPIVCVPNNIVIEINHE